MSTRAKEIAESLTGFDYEMNDGLQNETKKKEVTNSLLIVKITNNFEAKFLASLCTREKENDMCIELCVKFEDVIKPIGYFDLTFDNIQKIHEYNNKIKIGILQNKHFEILTPEQEICLC
jgi:hypothetical protein